MTQFMKHIEKEIALPLKKQVDHRKGQVVSKTIVQNEHVTMTLYAFDKDEILASHKHKGDVFLYIIEGTAQVTVGEVENVVTGGEIIVIPANKLYAVYALESFKMLSVMIFG